VRNRDVDTLTNGRDPAVRRTGPPGPVAAVAPPTSSDVHGRSLAGRGIEQHGIEQHGIEQHGIERRGIERWVWQAACQDEDGAWFFAPERESAKGRAARTARAKFVCAQCSVRADCLEYALKVRESFGIWGGQTPEERDAILRARRRTERSRARDLAAQLG
jgi:WhiB family redox-sensing transcriptional regulator